MEPAVSVGLTLDRQSASYGDTVNGVVTIAAAGADISDITVYDDVNNTVIADTIEVNAGNTATITCSWPVRGLTDYRVRIEGINTAGQKVEGFSNTVEIGLDGEFSESSLSISANAQTPRINQKGKVRISIAIINDGNVAARDVILTEATLGELRRFEFVPAGEPTVSSIIVDVKDDTDYVFAVAYEQAGESVTVQSEPVSVVIASDGEDPVSEKDEDNAGEVYEISSPSRYYWMLAAGGFVLIVLIILLIVSHDRERREKKLRRELGKQRRLESEKTKHK